MQYISVNHPAKVVWFHGLISAPNAVAALQVGYQQKAHPSLGGTNEFATID